MSKSSSNIAFALSVENNRGALTETLNDGYPSYAPVKYRILSYLVGVLFKIIPQAVRTIHVIHRLIEMANSVVCSGYFSHCTHCKLQFLLFYFSLFIVECCNISSCCLFYLYIFKYYSYYWPFLHQKTHYPSGRTWANIRYCSGYSSLV